MPTPPNQEQRAGRAWPVLVQRAATRSTVTYSELGRLIGGVHQRAIRFVLGPIQDYCLEEKLPPLTILVVQAARGRPGTGFIAWDVDDIDAGLELVYSYPWSSAPNPFAYATGQAVTQASLAARLVARPDDAGDVYSIVRVRGVAQKIFRLALLEAYGYACAFCGTEFEAALQAAHIVPWRHCSPKERLDPRNGVLLCATHHALFDAGFLRIDERRRICHHDDHNPLAEYSESDLWFTKRLDGQPLRGPDKVSSRTKMEGRAS